MKKIQDFAAGAFLVAVVLLSLVSILGVWEIFGRDVITKSFETIGLLAGVAVIVMVAGRFMEGKNESGVLLAEPNPIFKNIRQATIAVLIVAVSLLALLGVLAIWEVITDKTFLYKVMSSLGILSFGALVTVMTCLERENKFQNNGAKSNTLSLRRIVGIIVILWIVSSFFGVFRYFW